MTARLCRTVVDKNVTSRYSPIKHYTRLYTLQSSERRCLTGERRVQNYCDGDDQRYCDGGLGHDAAAAADGRAQSKCAKDRCVFLSAVLVNRRRTLRIAFRDLVNATRPGTQLGQLVYRGYPRPPTTYLRLYTQGVNQYVCIIYLHTSTHAHTHKHTCSHTHRHLHAHTHTHRHTRARAWSL